MKQLFCSFFKSSLAWVLLRVHWHIEGPGGQYVCCLSDLRENRMFSRKGKKLLQRKPLMKKTPSFSVMHKYFRGVNWQWCVLYRGSKKLHEWYFLHYFHPSEGWKLKASNTFVTWKKCISEYFKWRILFKSSKIWPVIILSLKYRSIKISKTEVNKIPRIFLCNCLKTYFNNVQIFYQKPCPEFKPTHNPSSKDMKSCQLRRSQILSGSQKTIPPPCIKIFDVCFPWN